ncbi:MAG: sigma-70 family RNA polymerase sigma factor [Symploca sp. SIO1C4]|uniref:Sigma-70 family RNA polymerase sigma factor n=1 Tax=Symploca sp. SIO1C4 TaxID=2607765 RepID=A0A6B3NB30_9CYAN|nr:sigma-70 family RNA polymerase sigma factor [Symploca sp. SIO1C4]
MSLAKKRLKEKLSCFFQDTNGEVATVSTPQRPTPVATGEKPNQREPNTKVAKDSNIVPRESKTEELNSTGAIAENSTPDLTTVGTPLALDIAVLEKAVATKSIDHHCGSEKSVGVCDSLELAQNSCRSIVVSCLSRFGSLPERLRNSFRLHFYQQRSHTEIAAEQGITYDNVCKRISSARKEYKKEYKERLRGSNKSQNSARLGQAKSLKLCPRKRVGSRRSYIDCHGRFPEDHPFDCWNYIYLLHSLCR